MEAFDTWAIVELLGHRRIAGHVTEAEIAGGKLLRVDIPASESPGDPATFATQFYGIASIYCLTPTTEEIARSVAARSRPTPVQPWEMPRIAAPQGGGGDSGDDDEDTDRRFD